MTALHVGMPQDELLRAIHAHGAHAREARQIEGRLRDLLPRRLADLKSRLRGTGAESSVALGLRRALLDPEYVRHMDELIEMAYTARRERIEYETHHMLFDARRSLRAFHRR